VNQCFWKSESISIHFNPFSFARLLYFCCYTSFPKVRIRSERHDDQARRLSIFLDEINLRERLKSAAQNDTYIILQCLYMCVYNGYLFKWKLKISWKITSTHIQLRSKREWIEINWNGFKFSEILIHEC